MTAPKDWPSKNYLAMIMTGDNQGPPSLADVENLRQYAEKNMPGVRVHFGTLDDFAHAVLAEKPELPVVRGDMPDTWIHGWLSMPIESKAAHTVRPLQPAVETLDTQLRAWGLTTGDLAPRWPRPTSRAFSTASIPLGLPPPIWARGTAARCATFMARLGRKLTIEAPIRNTSRFSTTSGPTPARRPRSSTASFAAGWICWPGRLRRRPRVVVYNALPWPRSGLAEVYLSARQVPLCPGRAGQRL